MKRFQFFVLTLLIAVGAGAQQLATSSLYEMYGVLHNPSTAGSQKYATLGGSFKTQWSDIPGAPKTGLLFGSTYMPKHNLGVGGYIYNDQTGPLTYNGLAGHVAYHIPMKNNTALFSLGLEARVLQYRFDQTKLKTDLGADPVIMGDPERIKGDAGFGISYTDKKFQVGLSASQLIQSKLNLYEGTGSPTTEGTLARHFYAHGYYNWDVDKVTRIIPHMLVIYLPNAPTDTGWFQD